MMDLYGVRKYRFSSLNGVLLFFFSFILYSCSIRGGALNINPITMQLLNDDMRKHVNGVFPYELRSKLQTLANEGFIGGVDPNNDNMRKHLMFVFYHSLDQRQCNMTLQNRLNFFQNDPNGRNLVWDFRLINIGAGARQRQVLEFRLKNIFGVNAPAGNRNRAIQGRAPRFTYTDLGVVVTEGLEVDHLLKENNIVIELPLTLHQQKTRFMDNLINPPDVRIIRDSAGYWRRR